MDRVRNLQKAPRLRRPSITEGKLNGDDDGMRFRNGKISILDNEGGIFKAVLKMLIRGCEKLQKYEYFTRIVKAITFFLGHGFDFFVCKFLLLTKNGLVFENFAKF